MLSASLNKTFLSLSPDPTTNRTMSGRSNHVATYRSINTQCCNGRKERNVLFNDALNTFYLRLYGALAGTRNSSMRPPSRIDPTTHRTTSERSYHALTNVEMEIFFTRASIRFINSWHSPIKSTPDRRRLLSFS